MGCSFPAPRDRLSGRAWFGALGVWAAALLAGPIRPVRADGGAGDADGAGVEEGRPAEQITVYGEREVQRRRNELARELKRLGYHEGRHHDGRTVYRPETPWFPEVVVFDDGFVVMRRSPPTFGMPPGVSKWWDLACPLVPHMCIHLGGQLVSPRKLSQVKGKVLAGMRPALHAWQEAIVAHAIDERVNGELPGLLDAVWHSGVPIEPDDPPLTTPAARRAAILDYWVTRTCTPAGAKVRSAVAEYLENEVQSSQFPVTAAELAQVNARDPCGDPLRLTLPHANPPDAP